MRKELRLKSFDNYLLVTMSALMLLSLYMLYGVRPSSSDSDNRVASIVEQLKTVKRKSSLYQGWMDVKSGDELSPNDEIYTHGQSSAKIKFINGPEISLFENSLLRIKTLNSKNTFALDKGNLIAKLDKDNPILDIELSGKKYSFQSTGANIQVEQDGKENKFMLLEGKAKMADREILPNQVVIQDLKSGVLRVQQIPFVVENPVNNLKRYFNVSATINFTWKNLNQEHESTLSVYRDLAMTQLVDSSLVTGKNTHSFDFSEAGTYFWRITTKDQISSPIRSFTLLEEQPLELNVNRNILYKGPKISDKALLKWSKNNGKKFLVKIEFPDGKIEEVSVDKNSYELTPTILGEYRLSAKINDDFRPEAIWSSPLLITAKEAEAVIIQSLTPPLIEKVNYQKVAHNHLLSWSGPNSLQYQIKLTKEGKVSLFQTEHTSYPLSLKEPGEYTWEIRGETLSGVSSNILTGKIVLKTPLKIAQLPAEGAVVELEKPDQLVSFKWDQVTNSSQYQFELSDDPQFKNILVDKTVETNNASTSIASIGKYFWRVKVKKGESTEYSSPVSVEIRPSPPLSTPETSPVKIQLKYLEEKSSSSFHWLDFIISRAHASDPVAVAQWDLPANPRAKSYVVEIYQDAKLSKLITRIESDVPHVSWKNAAAGIFYWRVSYIDHWGRQTEFSKVSTLETEMAPIPVVEIALNSPAHKSEITLEEDQNIALKWELIENNKLYSVIIANDLEFENILLDKKVNSDSMSINCKDLGSKEGQLYWKVVAGKNSSKRRSFHVRCFVKEKIAEVKPVLPEEKSIIPPPLPEAPIHTPSNHFASVGIFPHQVSYQNKSALYTAKINGSALNSLYGNYHRPLEWSYFNQGSLFLSMSRGKVFNQITFTDLELNFKLHREQVSFSWGPILSFAKRTLYVEANRAITDESLSTPMAGVFIQKNIERLKLNGEIKFGTFFDWHADIQYRFKDRYTVGAFFETSTLTKDNNKHSFTKLGLLINYTFDFLNQE